MELTDDEFPENRLAKLVLRECQDLDELGDLAASFGEVNFGLSEREFRDDFGFDPLRFQRPRLLDGEAVKVLFFLQALNHQAVRIGNAHGGQQGGVQAAAVGGNHAIAFKAQKVPQREKQADVVIDQEDVLFLLVPK